jgi:signal peptidase I
MQTFKQSYLKLTHALITLCEIWLTHLARKKFLHQAKLELSRAKHGLFFAKIYEWIWAFFSAALWVFFINQYLVQAYQIPSESMVDTLLVGDRVFVNKLTAGPELLPGVAKIPAFVPAKRGDIIIFSNPDMQGDHTLMQVIHRLVYMLSLSTIDLGNREQKAQTLVKRAAGYEGDTIKFIYGDMYIKPQGYDNFISETQFQNLIELKYPVKRQLLVNDYDNAAAYTRFMAIKDAVERSAYPKEGYELPAEYTMWQQQSRFFADKYSDMAFRATQEVYYTMLMTYTPYERQIQQSYLKHKLGIYVPEGYVLPLGDNRDNSADGRYFGLIKKNQILGKMWWRFFPFNRFGYVR